MSALSTEMAPVFSGYILKSAFFVVLFVGAGIFNLGVALYEK
jgi:hypothetical protein